MRNAMVPLLVVAALSCAPHRSRMKALEPAVLSFNSQVRWGRLSEAGAYVPASHADDFMVRLASLKDELEIVSYEVITTRRTRTRGVEVLVRFEWIRKDEGRVLESWVRERWVYRNERWYCVAMQGIKGEPWPVEYEVR